MLSHLIRWLLMTLMIRIKMSDAPADVVHTHMHAHTHTHTQPFYGPLGFCPGIPRWASTRRVKPGRSNQSGFTGATDNERQWHQLGHMQICITPTHNHASIPPLIKRGRCTSRCGRYTIIHVFVIFNTFTAACHSLLAVVYCSDIKVMAQHGWKVGGMYNRFPSHSSSLPSGCPVIIAVCYLSSVV